MSRAKPWLIALSRIGIALLFLYAGGIKALHTQDFAYDVQSYQLTSWTLSILVAVYLPWLEICVGLSILVRRLYLGALACATLLMCVFLGAILSAWWRGLDITCGCFGPEVNHTNYPVHIAADLSLVAVLALLFVAEARHFSKARETPNVAARP